MSTGGEQAAIFSDFLSKGVRIHVVVDTTAAGVRLPAHLRGAVTLEYGKSLPIPIPDLEATPEGITATLSFKRMPHKTFVPWAAVQKMWAVSSDGPARCRYCRAIVAGKTACTSCGAAT